LWTYIKSQRKNKSGISSLVVNDTVYNKDTDKASILNNHFFSVFTKQDSDSFPTMRNPPPSQSNDIQVGVQGVASLLNDITVS